jgi:mutator protein MutT
MVVSVVAIVSSRVGSANCTRYAQESHWRCLAIASGAYASLEHARDAHTLHRDCRRHNFQRRRSRASAQTFRAGSGWGLPGGFLEAGEQPLAALKRELREEIGMEVESAEVFTARSFKNIRQVEVLYLCRANSNGKPQTIEVERAEWFPVDSLPDGLPRDQRRLVERAAQSQ